MSNSFVKGEIEGLRVMAWILPPVFLGITVFLVNMVIGRIIAPDRAEIGLRKALGQGDGEVGLHYVLLAGVITVIGILLGWAAGTIPAQVYARFHDFPYLIYRMPVQVYARSAVLALAAAILGAMRSARAAGRLAPALAMAPTAPPRFRRRAIDRALARLRVPQPTMMILRWPLRAALTAPGLALAVAVLVASGFFGDAFAAILDSAFDQPNRQDATLIFADDRPRVAPEEVRRLPGVVQAEPQLLIPAILRHGPAEKRVAIEGRQPGADPGRVGDAEGRVVTPAPDALHLSQRLAGALDVAPGDRLRVEFLGGRRERVELPVAGVVPLFIGLGAYTEIDSLDALQRRAPRLPVVNVALDHRQGQAFHAPLEEIPRLSAAVFTTENRRAFEQTIAQNIAVSATVYVALGVMITFGMACNAARIQLSERARELASLRILGFTRAEVGYVLTGETLLLALLAQPLGRGIGAGVARLFTERFSSDL